MSQKSFSTSVSNNTSFGNPVFANATGEVSDGDFDLKPILAVSKHGNCYSWVCGSQGGGQNQQPTYCTVTRIHVGVYTKDGKLVPYYPDKNPPSTVEFGAKYQGNGAGQCNYMSLSNGAGSRSISTGSAANSTFVHTMTSPIILKIGETTITTPNALFFMGNIRDGDHVREWSWYLEYYPELKSGTAETLRILREHSNQDF